MNESNSLPTKMVTKGAGSRTSIVDDRESDDVMGSLFLFDWDDDSVDSLITKFLATPREGLCIPKNIAPHDTTIVGLRAFKNDLLSHMVDTEESASVQYGSVVCEDQGSAARFVCRLATLDVKPWMQAILAQGKPLPGKLAKVTVAVRNVPTDVFPCANALFY